MPIRSYGVLKGRPVVGEIRSSGPNKPHYHIRLDAGGESLDIAVNVQSVDGSEVLYHVEHDFHPPDPEGLIALPDGFTPLAQRGDRTAHHPLALDFIREGLVHEGQMHPLEIGVRSVQNDLENEVDDLTHRIDPNPDAKMYAFGSRFPGGIHDIHMNQGNPRGAFGGDNGIYQDGAVFVHLPSQDRWLAVFIAFQTQSWDTDERGNPLRPPGREADDDTEGRRASGPPEDERRARPPAPDDRRPARRHAHGRHHHH